MSLPATPAVNTHPKIKVQVPKYEKGDSITRFFASFNEIMRLHNITDPKYKELLLSNSLPKDTANKLWPTGLEQNSNESDADYHKRTYNHLVDAVKNEHKANPSECKKKWNELKKPIDLTYEEYLDQMLEVAKEANVTDIVDLRIKFVDSIKNANDASDMEENFENSSLSLKDAAKALDRRLKRREGNVFHVGLAEEIDEKINAHHTELQKQIEEIKTIVVASATNQETKQEKTNGAENNKGSNIEISHKNYGGNCPGNYSNRGRDNSSNYRANYKTGYQGNYSTNNSENWRNKNQSFGNYNSNNYNARGNYNRGRGQNTYRGSYTNRYNQNPNHANPDLCYYHRRFGAEAFKCEGNCPMFQSSKN